VNAGFTVSGASSTNGTIVWTENGAGSITAGATTLTPTYTPAAGDAGTTVTLTMTVTGTGSCTPAVDTKALTVTAAPTADAGAASGETCVTTAFVVSGASTNNVPGIVWTENGLGSITAGATTLTPTYTPAAGDAGTIVTLTMTVSGAGSCAPAVDTKALTVTASPIANAGAATAEICETSAYTVTDASFSNGTILWTEDGGGTLLNATTLSPTYTPVAADAGTTVTLTMTVSNGSCTNAVDTKALTVTDTPTADAGTPTGETWGTTPITESGATTNNFP
jgi:hypothetical protein